jgi:hypothetical protein
MGREHADRLWWTENFVKLTRSSHTELHLALRVHEAGVPFALLSAFMDGDMIPVGDPAGMESLTDLWVVIRYGTNAVHWSARERWTVHNYATPEEHAATVRKNSDAIKRMIETAERASASDS